MKYIVTLLLATSLGIVGCKEHMTNTQMKKEVEQVILNLEKATSQRNVEEIEKYLHQDYRVMANRFKGTKATTILTRDTYLSMIREEKIGGTSYQTNFNSVSITDHTASVDLLFKSDQTSDMHKYLFLVKDENDAWKVISDLPIVLE